MVLLFNDLFDTAQQILFDFFNIAAFQTQQVMMKVFGTFFT
jgi:hypothetical protein